MRYLVASIVCALVMIGCGVGFAVQHIKAYNFTGELRLADDASTPEQKAIYLGQFIAKLESTDMPEYGAYVSRNAQTKISNQIAVLRSLKERCDAIAPLNKESMGYSQGMTQITGQEFENAVDHVQQVFNTAYRIERYGLLGIFGVPFLGAASMLGMAIFFGGFLNE